MLDATLKAFFARYKSADGAALRAALAGGLHLVRAPQDAAKPYAVYFTVYNADKDTFTEWLRKLMVQVNIFGATAGAVTALHGQFRTLYKDKPISAAGIKPAMLVEGATYGPFAPEGDGDPWQVGAEFIGWVEKSA